MGLLFLETTRLIKILFHKKLTWVRRRKCYPSGLGHMTKMAVIIQRGYSQILRQFWSETRRPRTSKFGMQLHPVDFYADHSDYGPGVKWPCFGDHLFYIDSYMQNFNPCPAEPR